MAQDADFDQVMARLQAGDARAADQVFKHFSQRLVALARKRLSTHIRRKVDPEEVVQSAFRSFFTRQAGGEFDLNNWDSLWGMLTVITLRKCGHQVRHFHAVCRNIEQELSPMPVGDDSSFHPGEALAREPTPAEAARLAEVVKQLMGRLDERERRMLSLSLQGYSIPEISARVDRTERTVQRLLERVRKQLERMQEEKA